MRGQQSFLGVRVGVAGLSVAALVWTASPGVSGQAGGAASTALDVYAKEQGSRPVIEVWGNEVMVSSTHPLASMAGARILAAGGNAVDAAVAVGAALNVTALGSNQIGGDTVMLIYWAETNEFVALDAYSKVPSNPKLVDMLKALPGVQDNPKAYMEEPRSATPGQPPPRSHGVLVAQIPGTAAAWTRAMERFGSKPLSEVFAPAIEYADKGFALSQRLAGSLARSATTLKQYPSTAKVFYPDGDAPQPGEILEQKDLANTFRRLAAGGFDEFYKGQTAKAIVDYVQAHGGVFTMEDMANYDVAWRQPVRTTYRGYDVVGAPPPTSAIHVLQQLNIVEQFDLARLGYHSADMLHVMIEATKLAGADRRGISGDPDFVRTPARGLLSKKYAAERKALIDMRKAIEPKYDPGKPWPYESEDTTHFVVIDRHGNMVSCTTTLGSGFGSKEVVDGTGILLQDRTWWLALEPPSPNIVAPNRRANIGHSPTMILKDGKPFMAVGSPGGDTIRQSVFQTIVNVIDYGFNIQQAIEAPRFSASPLENSVNIDVRIDPAVLADLEQRGHQLDRSGPWSGPGNVEGFTIDPRSGARMGGYDPRGNSIAIGW